MKKTVLFAAALVMFAAASTARAGDSVLLRLNFQKGDVCPLDYETKTLVKETVMGIPVEVDQTILFRYTYEVTNVLEDGTAGIRIIYSDLSVRKSQAGNETSYDSSVTNAVVPDSLKTYAFFKGLRISLACTPRGEVVDFSGMSGLIAKIRQQMASNDTAFAKTVMDSIEKQFSDDSMKQMFQTIMGYFPEKPVKPGAVWTMKNAVNFIFPITMVTRYRLVSVEADTIVLGLSSKYRMNSAGGGIFGSMGISLKMQGDLSGTMTISRTNGFVVSSESTQNLKGTIRIGKPVVKKDIVAPMTAVATIRISRRQ